VGEAEHHIGSDFLAKAPFVKYLFEKKDYKDIVFESAFFGLYFDHKK
jgi:erythromycin esterase